MPTGSPHDSMGKAVVQPHCHHRAVLGLESERELFKRLGMEAEVLDAGCCGMAGSFGFETGDKYEVSLAVGERVLLPRIRETAASTVVVADGFSCSEQIRQGSERSALHLAELLQMALHARPAEEFPERRVLKSGPTRPAIRTIAGLSGLAMIALLLQGVRRG